MIPTNLDSIMPHRKPMQMLEELVEASPERARGHLTIRPDNLFLGKDGLLDRAAFPEIMAQCFAAAAGHLSGKRTDGNEGYLAAISHLKICQDARLDDSLDVEVEILAEVSGVTVLAGKIMLNASTIASAELKIYLPKTVHNADQKA